MNKEATAPTSISLDLKKYRIRIHKATVHLLGDPKYIQLLVNTTTRHVAIRAVEKDTSNDQTHKVNLHQMESDNSFEIYSRFFLTKLCSLIGNMEPNNTYRLSGEVIASEKIALFSWDTITRVEPMESDDEH